MAAIHSELLEACVKEEGVRGIVVNEVMAGDKGCLVARRAFGLLLPVLERVSIE